MTGKPIPPTAQDLLDAIEEFLREDAAPNLEGYSRFRARVASNLVAMLRRELASTESLSGDAELASEIRHGSRSWRDAEVLNRVKSVNLNRLRIHNPKWIIDS